MAGIVRNTATMLLFGLFPAHFIVYALGVIYWARADRLRSGRRPRVSPAADTLTPHACSLAFLQRVVPAALEPPSKQSLTRLLPWRKKSLKIAVTNFHVPLVRKSRQRQTPLQSSPADPVHIKRG